MAESDGPRSEFHNKFFKQVRRIAKKDAKKKCKAVQANQETGSGDRGSRSNQTKLPYTEGLTRIVLTSPLLSSFQQSEHASRNPYDCFLILKIKKKKKREKSFVPTQHRQLRKN